MSAFLDAQTDGGYDGSLDGGIGDTASNWTYQASPEPSYFTGALQSLTSLGTGYLARRIDIDLYSRAQQATPYMQGTQNQLLVSGAGVPRPGGIQPVGAPTMLNLNALLPFLLVGGAVFLLARK